MSSDGYVALMGDRPAHLTLKLDTSEPVELGDFVGAFTSIANEFDRYLVAEHRGTKSDPRFFVKEVRSGCIEADLITGITIGAGLAIQYMDQAMILEDFVGRWGRRISALVKGKPEQEGVASAAELTDFYHATQAIAADPLANHRLEAAVFEDSKRQVRAAFQFSAIEARSAQQTIEDTRSRLLAKTADTKKRVLMRFTRTDVHDAALNKRSGERVVIEEVSAKDYPVMYASEMAEREIREHIRDADQNAYKRGFVVDVAVQMSGDTILAYAVMSLHSVIDIG